MTDEGVPAQRGGQGETDGFDPAPVGRLLATLEQEYPLLLQRLSNHLRSRDAAEEALHDVYLKLRSEPTIANLRNPRAYLYRMAINLSLNQRRSENRTKTLDDTAIAHLADEQPDPERVVLASDEIGRALSALHSLSSKRRDIFLARWRDEKSQAQIALEFGLHKRSVQKELSKAEAYLRRVLRRSKRAPL
ncbi:MULTISPECIES: RNA polymerase sigma factor [Sphingomonadaceae]|jgi:RNA polymerase sigma factor (sigma-70 family)|uniref:RNA polymerase sigma factor n=1 Tax=Sphingomonadales TaxID=204457 RepID=UPI000A3A5AF0|nr:RNA polymerase sigma factor [Sphingobium sp. GW456-12-10-14-TSB1]OUC52952.1 hypothetical protein CA262_20375 [Sphingobium sp. GW456-12-10-14-TSB1]